VESGNYPPVLSEMSEVATFTKNFHHKTCPSAERMWWLLHLYSG